MRSRGGAHALLGSTDWAVAVRPYVYACMCPATLAPLTPMHARLTPTYAHSPTYAMRSRGGAHALLGSTDWAVAVRPYVYACMCPATLAPLTPMHARLTLTCGSDYSDGVTPMPHACKHGLNHSTLIFEAWLMQAIRLLICLARVCLRACRGSISP